MPPNIPDHERNLKMHLAFRVLLWLALVTIFVNATLPGDRVTFEIFSWDKLNHGFAFLVLGFLANYASPNRPLGWTGTVLLIGYGVAIEVTQYFVPGRDSSILDVIADGSGLLLFRVLRPWVGRLPVLRGLASRDGEVTEGRV